MAGAPSGADAALAGVVRGDDRPAVAGLFDRHGGLLFGLAMSMLRDQEDAEMVVVRTFDDICRGAPRFQSGTDVRNWLLARVRAHAISMVRARLR
ncbi:MAG: sigma factor [Gemmatimonadota bacterium]